MDTSNDEEKVLLLHHKQQELCTTRLPYRQGRKLTAVKTYTIADESNHLLIFNVPSLNLRKETKSLFQRFGQIKLFAISPVHPTEKFTETYHCVYERIQSARIAKKVLDTYNFYGESLHVCYAPELETLSETRQKLLQRKTAVINRLKNLAKDTEKPIKHEELNKSDNTNTKQYNDKIDNDKNKRINMGEINTISIGKQIRDVVFKSNKRKLCSSQTNINKIKSDSINTSNSINITTNTIISSSYNTKAIDKKETIKQIESKPITYPSISVMNPINNDTAIVDCTSTEKEVITNINDTLNYNSFGNEDVRKVDVKPLNRIKFNFKK